MINSTVQQPPGYSYIFIYVYNIYIYSNNILTYNSYDVQNHAMVFTIFIHICNIPI